MSERTPGVDFSQSPPRALPASLRRVSRWGLAILALYLVALTLGTHVREEDLPVSLRYEIALHFFAYAGLTLLVHRIAGSIFRGRGALGEAGRAGATLVVVLALALVDEVTQPAWGRSFQGKDLWSDLAGALTMLFLIAIARIHSFRRSLRRPA